MEERKKFKGQVPYTLYAKLKKDAETQKMRISEYLLEIVEQAVNGPQIYDGKDGDHAVAVRGESPNNVHFVAGPTLQWRFELFKKFNHIESDSVAIRAILFHHYAKDEVKSDCVQGTFF